MVQRQKREGNPLAFFVTGLGPKSLSDGRMAKCRRRLGHGPALGRNGCLGKTLRDGVYLNPSPVGAFVERAAKDGAFPGGRYSDVACHHHQFEKKPLLRH